MVDQIYQNVYLGPNDITTVKNKGNVRVCKGSLKETFYIYLVQEIDAILLWGSVTYANMISFMVSKSDAKMKRKVTSLWCKSCITFRSIRNIIFPWKICIQGYKQKIEFSMAWNKGANFFEDAFRDVYDNVWSSSVRFIAKTLLNSVLCWR